ncbi:MAG: hypothetical protein CMC96_14825 [Flavobacteriales bacterium]|nr:hypothetical protein [Flavobacteriales bacterium]
MRVNDFYLNESLNLLHFLMLKKKQDRRPLCYKKQEVFQHKSAKNEPILALERKLSSFNFPISYFNRA